MSRTAIKLVLAMWACAFSGPAVVRAADQNNPATQPTAQAVMDKTFQDVLVILRDHKLSVEQKRDKIKAIAYDRIDFEVMGHLSLGKFSRGLSDAQKTQFQQEFKQFVTNTYIVMVDSYTDQNINVIGSRQEDDGDWTVQSRVTDTKEDNSTQEVAKVDYRLRKQDNQWKVIDFNVDGVSMVVNFRSQFQETMSSGGIDQLLKLLHEKNAANDKK